MEGGANKLVSETPVLKSTSFSDEQCKLILEEFAKLRAEIRADLKLYDAKREVRVSALEVASLLPSLTAAQGSFVVKPEVDDSAFTGDCYVDVDRPVTCSMKCPGGAVDITVVTGTTPSPFGAASTSSPSYGAATGFSFSFDNPASGSTATTTAASTPRFDFPLSSNAVASITTSTLASASTLGFGATTGSSLFGSTTSASLFSSSTLAAVATTAPTLGIPTSPATTTHTLSFGSSGTATAVNKASSLFSVSSASAFSFPMSTTDTPTMCSMIVPNVDFGLGDASAKSLLVAAMSKAALNGGFHDTFISWGGRKPWPPPMLLEILHYSAKVRPLPWPFFI